MLRSAVRRLGRHQSRCTYGGRCRARASTSPRLSLQLLPMRTRDHPDNKRAPRCNRFQTVRTGILVNSCVFIRTKLQTGLCVCACLAEAACPPVVCLCIFVCQYSRSQWLQTHRRFNLGKSTIRCSENDDVSSRSSPMVSLSKSIQQVAHREAARVLQGQGLANSQYDDNSMLAFSFPEETDSPWQLRPKMFAYFCSNKFYSAF